MPANFILRAVPLAAGRHRLRIEYSPKAFRVGKWVSIVSLIIYAGFLGWHLRQRKKESSADYADDTDEL